MQIQKIQNNNYNPNFGLWSKEVYTRALDGSSVLKHRNDTSFFRGGRLWYLLQKELLERYKNVPNVNVYCYGCSDGSEPYTFVMSLLSRHKYVDVKKFFPIMAKDYDAIAIEQVKNNRYNIGDAERKRIQQWTNRKFDKYFDNVSTKNDLYSYYGVKSIVSDNVHFEIANILEDYKNIEPENSIVFARNFWPYLDENERNDLAYNLYKHLGKSSLLIVGDYDLSNKNVARVLITNGFIPDDENKFIHTK